MIQIPVFQDVSADFVQNITLGGQLVKIQIVYNSRAGFFFLTFTDPFGSVLRDIKVVPNWPLTDLHRGLIQFDGDLIVVQTDTEAGDEITYDNLGNGWDLMYMTPDEITDWKLDNGF